MHISDTDACIFPLLNYTRNDILSLGHILFNIFLKTCSKMSPVINHHNPIVGSSSGLDRLF